MTELFLQILEQTVAGSYVILIAIALRMLLNKMPRRPMLLLWAAAALRLMVPFSLPGPLSLFPPGTDRRFIPGDILFQLQPAIKSGLPAFDQTVNALLPAAKPIASVNQLQIQVLLGTGIWITGMAVILLWNLLSVHRLKRRLAGATQREADIFEADGLPTAFVLGILRPRIYLPKGLGPQERQHILLHEHTHIARGDHILKPLTFLIPVIHWFNPLVWIGYRLMGQDLEMACDEAVLKEYGDPLRTGYAASLLTMASDQRPFPKTPLAFSEGDTARRIRRILSYRRPALWVSILALVLTAGCSLSLVTDPAPETGPGSSQPSVTAPASSSSADTTPLITIPAARGKLLEAKPADLQAGLARGIGSDAPDLVYASDDMIMINAGFGLLIYDLEQEAVIASLDLPSIGCDYFQGDAACEILVSRDGSLIQLHPASSDTMFRFDLKDLTLYGEIPYLKMEDHFKTQLIFDVPETIPSTEWTSIRSVRFEDGTYGYLKVPDGKLDQIVYVRGAKVQRLFP